VRETNLESDTSEKSPESTGNQASDIAIQMYKYKVRCSEDRLRERKREKIAGMILTAGSRDIRFHLSFESNTSGEAVLFHFLCIPLYERNDMGSIPDRWIDNSKVRDVCSLYNSF
jgi:hypothetical protein